MAKFAEGVFQFLNVRIGFASAVPEVIVFHG
jgi:hypothetical protein